MKETLLSGENLEKKYLDNKVIDNINIDIYKNDFTVIMGSSGAGKSTLLYLLSGMDKPSSGNVFYDGLQINRCNEKQMANLRCKKFGFVFQQSNLVSNLTIFENIAVAGYINKSNSVKVVNEKVNFLLDNMHITNIKSHLPSQISGSESQRTAVARAVINDPEIIFADEPTGALNKSNTEEVMDIFTNINRAGQSILMVTHDLHSAIRGNRILYMEDGKITNELMLSSYTTDDAKKREEQISVWLTNMRW
jgi:putative ABC transport system ATP-binding protein